MPAAPVRPFVAPTTVVNLMDALRRSIAEDAKAIEYHPLDRMDYRETVDRIVSSGAEVVFNTIVPPGVAPFLEQLHDAGFMKPGIDLPHRKGSCRREERGRSLRCDADRLRASLEEGPSPRKIQSASSGVMPMRRLAQPAESPLRRCPSTLERPRQGGPLIGFIPD